MPNAEIYYLKASNGSYSNGIQEVREKWQAMKNVDEIEHFLYTGAQRGAVFTFEVNSLPIPEKDVAEWEKLGYVVRDF